jgi:hypothetical protein
MGEFRAPETSWSPGLSQGIQPSLEVGTPAVVRPPPAGAQEACGLGPLIGSTDSTAVYLAEYKSKIPLRMIKSHKEVNKEKIKKKFKEKLFSQWPDIELKWLVIT